MMTSRPYTADGPLVSLVSTPIGNMEDITLRALSSLREADVIACEDTRNTSILLNYHKIKAKRLIALYSQNEMENSVNLVREIKEKRLKLCYCSDAGMPGISDPGALLVKECYKQDVPVTILPGASASLSALVLSSFSTADFAFYGFLSKKESQMRKYLEQLKSRTETLIFYESPKRVKSTLKVMRDVFGADRQVAVARELTKIHEETIIGSFEEVLEKPFEERGEFVLVVKGCEEKNDIDIQDVNSFVDRELKKQIPIAAIAKEVASLYSMRKNEAYDLVLKRKK